MAATGRTTARLEAVSEGRWSLSGPLTFDTVPRLWLAAGPLSAGATGASTEVDLGGVERVDSAGLALLVAWQGRVQASGGVLRYLSVPERLRAIARISEAEALLGD